MLIRKTIRRTGQRAFDLCRYLKDSAHSVGRRPTRVLLCSDELAYTSEQQLQPFRDHRRRLRDRRLIFLQTGTGTLLGSPAALLRQFDVVAVKLHYQSPVEVVHRVAGVLERLRGACRTVYLDGDDDCCVQWPEIAGTVDSYVKKHVLSDPTAYLRDYVGKSNLTDYVHRVHGVSFTDNEIPRCARLTSEQAAVIRLGWNIAQDEKIIALWQRLQNAAKPACSVDVVCRASVASSSWIRPLREPVAEALQVMAGRRAVLLPTERVSQERYYEEMLTSRICVSPFGFGEICWRDFEAIACGCLLVKPDMSHIRTAPDIFVPGETYVPVRWDFADLAETCESYLARPEELSRIARNAHAVLEGWYRGERVVDRILELLQAGARPETPHAV